MPASAVSVRREPVVFPTYEPQPPDKNPMFLENRVYQGSSGRVYPLPFYNRIAEQPQQRAWDSVTIENEFIRVMVLPEIGGRIHVGQDKTNGYDFFYRQPVIKPALVGLSGPWASGGVEFNWPQHHRPATFMRVDVEIEEHEDGSKTIWLGDHDPMERLKGMHGVCLHPGRALIELKMRAYNRTPLVQSFLWWANVATRAHEAYQSFFPPDVAYVADHARRAMSRFPHCDGRYYGVDYGSRAKAGVPANEVPRQFVPPHCRPERKIEGVPTYAPDDLSWYANIPVPTSYMCLGSKEDFSGGYDYYAKAGLIQIANHHIAPGKKQWTWGNQEFGYAWDRNLTEGGGPYVELMIGVYTDNQPDFSFLQPGETKSWSVYWYPIQQIGPAQAANVDAAISLTRDRDRARVGVAVTRARQVQVEVLRSGKRLQEWTADVAPDAPFITEFNVPARTPTRALQVRVLDAENEVLSYAPRAPVSLERPQPAAEPASPRAIRSNDELYVTSLHLTQYRHATRSPVPYWEEALRRDPGDARVNTAFGVWRLRRGEFAEAELRFRAAIARLTERNANPYDGEPYYHLGLVLRYLGRDAEAYDAFYKATWNQAWQAVSFHALAEIDACRRHWASALEHLDRSLRLNSDSLRARNLRARVLRAAERNAEADAALAETMRLDPLDWTARWLSGQPLRCDTQTRIDLALESASCGFLAEAVALLVATHPEPVSGTGPLVQYFLADLYERLDGGKSANVAARRAAAAAPDYCFPSRLEEIGVLERAMKRNPRDARAPYYLGNLFYDRRRYGEAIALWQRSARLAPDFSTVWRNLGIAYFNVEGAPQKARQAYDRALRANPDDARLFYERDQLWKRVGEAASTRLRQFAKFPALVAQRDDATLELCALHNQTGQPQRALELVRGRRFQPWEGGEGQALGQYVRTKLALGRRALRDGRPSEAILHFEGALEPPESLGEARHPLANPSDVFFWLGEARAASGKIEAARLSWQRAAEKRGDFQDMSVREFSEMTYYSALSLERLGRPGAARKLLRALRTYARKLATRPARIDYFATSLPTMLLFNDDLTRRQKTTALFLQAQAEAGLGHLPAAKRLLTTVLARDPSHAAAADLRTELTRSKKS